ncbi:hypothetical protein QBC47DRAFT_31345 [Echria macrotheca]|uniref:Rhodopsin domain-containing protein n=1 Tax=Echria macrotheca TaxID=438768 RepID=A0AAJ0BP26_9PEZI|nr:hypothetical protein QBC47DRAFT_31345 [Echria macrotheca]
MMPGLRHDPTLSGQSRTGEIVAILSVACTISTCAVLLRCYCRHVILKSFGWDDAIMVPAQILTIACAVAIGLETKWGLGRHVWTMLPEHFVPFMKAFYSSIVVYNVAMSLTKISIVLQYRRLFPHTTMQRITLCLLCFLSAWGVTLSIMLPLACLPVEAFWNRAVQGRCVNFEAVWYAMAGVNVTTDFALFAMPIPVISSLRLPRRQKALLLVVFGLGIFPCAISIYRIRTLHAAAETTDPTWDNVGAATFSFLELTLGVVAVCLPTLRPILAVAAPRFFGSSLQSQEHQESVSIENGRRWSKRQLFDTKYQGDTLSTGCRLDTVLEHERAPQTATTSSSRCTKDFNDCKMGSGNSWPIKSEDIVAITRCERSADSLKENRNRDAES